MAVITIYLNEFIIYLLNYRLFEYKDLRKSKLTIN